MKQTKARTGMKLNQTVENVWIPDAKGRDWPQNEPKWLELKMT